jgi:DNA polymerase-1
MFYGLPEFSTRDWKIVNAIYGMGKFFVKQIIKEKPDFLFFVKDWKGKNFRHDLYKEYKSTRDRMPDNLVSQINDIEKMIKMMWIEVIEINWYEADDVIWTLSTMLCRDKRNDIYILSWDKDLYSLVNWNVKIYDTMKKQVFNKEKAKEKFWIEPEMIIDYLAIVWDKSDNIPGIWWFWPKKAIALINEIWSIDDIYREVDKVNNHEKKYSDFSKEVGSCFKWKTFEKLIESKQDAYLSKKLATIDLSTPLHDFVLDDHKFHPEKILNDNIVNFFKELEFFSLIWQEEKKMKSWNDLWLEVKLIQNKADLDKLFKKITKLTTIVLDTETTSINIMEAELTWISIYLDDNNIYYINRLHSWEKIPDDELKNFIDNLLSLDILIVWHNLKYDLEILELFRKNLNTQKKKSVQNSFWQMSFEV